MARISDDELDALKAQVSLLRLVEAKGIVLKKQGKDYAGACPFHEDDTPSLIVSPNKNLFHCFGCGEAGSVIDWVMKTEGVSFKHAVELLRHDFTPLAAEPVKQCTVRKMDDVLESHEDDQKLLAHVLDYYHRCLKQNADALSYLESRGLKNDELMNTFTIGFADRSLAYRLPKKNRKAGEEVRSQLQRLGILRATGHEHFNGSIVVPIINNHEVTEIYGRKVLGNRLRKGTPMHTYLPGPHQGVWNAQGLMHCDEVILCESLIDAMTFWVHGFRNVTASYGTEGFTDDHLAVFNSIGVKRVLIAYDRDSAGDGAAEKLSKRLISEGIDCFRIQFPKGMDANEYALKVQPAAKSLGLVIRKAEWLGKGKKPEITTNTSPLAAEIRQEKEATKEEVVEVQTPEVPEPPAARMPQLPKEINADVNDREAVMTFGPRRYRVRGMEKSTSYASLKVNLLISQDDMFYVDSLDLYSARQRGAFMRQASVELGITEDVLRQDVGQVLLKLEQLQDQHIQKTLAVESNVVAVDDVDREKALALLKAPDLMQRVLTDFTACGVIGEEVNKLVGYLACVSRKLDKPLAVLVQSSSAAGKSSLMDACLAFMPEEERVQYSAMTGQSLYYLGETDIKHKILAISEEEGVRQAAYALKLLQSEGSLTIASTAKDANSGDLVTKEYSVEGPVQLFLTTTASDVDEELLNRCLVLTVNESREQTEAIHHQQRLEETLEGLLQQHQKHDVLALHQNAQRLIKPLKVVNPYAQHLTFLNDKTRTRRDHKKYLALIRSIALLHQYQREMKTVVRGSEVIDYIEVTLDDIAIANELAHEVLGRTLDELPPQTRRLLLLIKDMVDAACKSQQITQSHYRFSRKDVRDVTQWGNTQLKVHLSRLEEMEYLLIHNGGRGKRIEYELLFDQDKQSADPHLMGLIDAQKLGYDAKKSGVTLAWSGSSRPQVGGMSGGTPTTQSLEPQGLVVPTHQHTENALLRNKNNGASYPSSDVLAQVM